MGHFHDSWVEIPTEILEAQEQGKLVVFVGAGVSMGHPSNLPSFEKLALGIAGNHPLSKEFDKYKFRIDRFLGELHRGGVDIQGLCRNVIGAAESAPTQLHGSIVDLFRTGSNVKIVTTNFDRHFRTILNERRVPYDSYDAPALPLGNQFSGLVYLHGFIDRDEPLVLSDEDFGRAYLTEGWAREFLQRLFAEFATLFIGYSHNDIPVEYLARGMAGKSLAPRFALTTASESGQWASLGIKEILFQKTNGENPYDHLYEITRGWADFMKLQPVEISERVKSITCSPENFSPDRAQISLLKRCLSRDDSYHYFTRTAVGWRWVKWLHDEQFLSPLFDLSCTKFTKAQAELAHWLGTQLLNEPTDKGLLLVDQYNGKIGSKLVSDLLWELWRNDKIDFTDIRIQRWILLLVPMCPNDSSQQVERLLLKAGKLCPTTLGMFLLRYLTKLRVITKKAFDWNAVLNPESSSGEREEKIDIEICSVGDVYYLNEAWHQIFTPMLPTMGNTLFRHFENRIHEVIEQNRAAGHVSDTYDLFCHREHIEHRATNRLGHGVTFLIDALLDTIDEPVVFSSPLTESKVLEWLSNGIPVFMRLGLYALDKTTLIPATRKVELLRQYHLIFPKVYGSSNESWEVLANSYQALSDSQKIALWEDVKIGPVHIPEGMEPADWAEQQHSESCRLRWILGKKHPECPLAAQILKDVAGESCLQGYTPNDEYLTFQEGLKSPLSVAELIGKTAPEQIDFLVEYKGSESPFEESREGLTGAVGAACAQNLNWCLSLLEELDKRELWASDLWNAGFQKLRVSALTQDQLAWLLKTVQKHYSELTNPANVIFTICRGIDFSPEKRPNPDNFEKLIELSLYFWNQTELHSDPKAVEFKKADWTSRAINHPAGHIVEFWMQCVQSQRRDLGEVATGFPEWLKSPLASMVEGNTYSSQLGRAILGMSLPFIYYIDSAWVKEFLFPKFRFSEVGEEAFLVWEPHARYGSLSRDLILTMPSLYREAFVSMRTAEEHTQTGFFGHIALIVTSRLLDVNQDGWLADFLCGLDEGQRSDWARQMSHCIESQPDSTRESFWEQWLLDYWTDRLSGRPCPLSSAEAEVMLYWAFNFDKHFPDVVRLIIQGPKFPPTVDLVLDDIDSHPAVLAYPNDLLLLLNWLLSNSEQAGGISNDIEKFIFGLPRLKAFLGQLHSLCQALAARGYPNVPELKARIDREFTQE